MSNVTPFSVGREVLLRREIKDLGIAMLLRQICGLVLKIQATPNVLPYKWQTTVSLRLESVSRLVDLLLQGKISDLLFFSDLV